MSKQVKPKKTDAVKGEETTEDKAEVMPVKFDFKSWAEESQLMEKRCRFLWSRTSMWWKPFLC